MYKRQGENGKGKERGKGEKREGETKGNLPPLKFRSGYATVQVSLVLLRNSVCCVHFVSCGFVSMHLICFLVRFRKSGLNWC